eukprot:TRINITY_DN7840_c0_g1_i1.p1 TRINITY_DN7840_c0_g1~~TRINITY_DN7840_c0_g1_i1.p1  ORF type:complete len:654 (-),score=133.13 TRINITY_DN7840_c0_g1_i1:57-2018(-)
MINNSTSTSKKLNIRTITIIVVIINLTILVAIYTMLDTPTIPPPVVDPESVALVVTETVHDKPYKPYSSSEEKEIQTCIRDAKNKYKNKENEKEAIKDLENCFNNRFPLSDVLCMEISELYRRKKDNKACSKWMQLAYDFNPNGNNYAYKLAKAYKKSKDYGLSRKFFIIAYDKNPTQARYNDVFWIKQKVNDFSGYEEATQVIINDINNKIRNNQNPNINPYSALHLPFNLEELQAIAHAKSLDSARKARGDRYEHVPDGDISRKIKVGYVSYDFRNHAVGIVMQNFFKYHNKDNFEIYAYNNNDEKPKDSIYKKILKSVDHMVQIKGMKAKDCAQRIYDDGIDILVDISLYTAGNRMDCFSLHPAPIQLSGIGLATTTGADYIDYLISDNYVVKPESMPYYNEKLMFMPFSYHPFSHKGHYPISPPKNRSSYGLPEDKILFCNHQNVIRTEPFCLNAWVEIIKRVENSALVIKDFGKDRKHFLGKEVSQRGLIVSEDQQTSQLLWMKGAGVYDHIPMKSMCDVYLDTHWYNGHSTTGDMLWAGVPILTYSGESMASRAAGSFALSMGFPEMITNSWEQFIERGVYLASSNRLKGLRKRVEDARETAPLFDTERYVSNLEKGMKIAFLRYQQSLETDHIHINDLEKYEDITL